MGYLHRLRLGLHRRSNALGAALFIGPDSDLHNSNKKPDKETERSRRFSRGLFHQQDKRNISPMSEPILRLDRSKPFSECRGERTPNDPHYRVAYWQGQMVG